MSQIKIKKINIMDTQKQINIFIVDDNKVFGQALKANIEIAFEGVPLMIQSFETGEKCMENLMQVKPELVILDYYLNTKYPYAADGVEVLDWIKKENPESNVIMLTRDDHIDVALKSFHHGASDYVVKIENQFESINHSIANIFTLYGHHLKELNVETEKDLNSNILKITMRINDQYPELSKYLEEMQDTIPDEKSPEITLKNLKAYYDSLNSMLNKYILERPNNAMQKQNL